MDSSRDLTCSSHDGSRESFQVSPMVPSGWCAGVSGSTYSIFASTPEQLLLLLLLLVEFVVIGDAMGVVAFEIARVVTLRTLSAETSTVLVRAIAVWGVVVVVVVVVTI